MLPADQTAIPDNTMVEQKIQFAGRHRDSQPLFPAMQLVPGSVIEGLRTAVGSQPHSIVLKTWLGLASGTISFEDFYQTVLADKQLTFLTIDTTGACDLTCREMCYYNPQIDTRQPLVRFDVLKQAIADAQRELKLRTLVIAGKEPFLNPKRMFELIRYSGSIKENDFTIGLITNGRHIHRHWDELKDLACQRALDFLDVSIDSGFPKEHDTWRGTKGTFELAFEAVRKASQKLPSVRVGISSVLRHDNNDGLFELIRLSAPTIKNFWIMPVQPPPFVNSELLSPAQIITFAKALGRLLQTDLKGSGLEILFVLYGFYLFDAVREGLFSWDELKENHEGQCYVERDLHGNRLQYICNVLPEHGWRLARITYSGDYLSHIHYLQAADPRRYATGNIQRESIAALYGKSKLRSGLFWKILDSRKHHSCRRRPCWNNCFGGLTASENSFLADLPLTEKPVLCLKTDKDFPE